MTGLPARAEIGEADNGSQGISEPLRLRLPSEACAILPGRSSDLQASY